VIATEKRAKNLRAKILRAKILRAKTHADIQLTGLLILGILESLLKGNGQNR
jgi:hypothetical protein